MCYVKKVGVGLLVLVSVCSLSGCGALLVDKYVAPDAVSGGASASASGAPVSLDVVMKRNRLLNWDSR